MNPASIEIPSTLQAQPSPQSRLTAFRVLLLGLLLVYDAMIITYMDPILSQILSKIGFSIQQINATPFDSRLPSAFLLGRLVSGPLWGILIDKHGRKLALLCVLTLVSLLTFILAFSSEPYDCLTLRMLIGLFNGIPVIVKTACTEICSTKFKSWSISFVNASWALGFIIGPLFSHHINQEYPLFEDQFTAPSLGITIIGGSLVLLSLLLFKESLPAQHQYQQIQPQGNRITNSIGQLDTRNEYIQLSHVLKIKNTAKLLAIFAIMILVQSGFDQLVFAWMNKIGFRWRKGDAIFNNELILNTYQLLSVILIVLQAIIYPTLQKLYGDYRILRSGHKVLLSAVISILFTRIFFSQEHPAKQITWVILCMLIKNMAIFMIFSAVQRFTNDIVSGNKRGKFNGCHIGLASSLLFTQPLGQQILHWSMVHKQHIFPFNYSLVFLLTCGMVWVSLSIVYNLVFADSNMRRMRGERVIIG